MRIALGRGIVRSEAEFWDLTEWEFFNRLVGWEQETARVRRERALAAMAIVQGNCAQKINGAELWKMMTGEDLPRSGEFVVDPEVQEKILQESIARSKKDGRK